MTDIDEAIKKAALVAVKKEIWDNPERGLHYPSIVRTALSALEAEGFVLVPKEPTEKMEDAVGFGWWADDVYRAMLSARPKMEEVK